jgi:hypothetical protein
VTRPPFGLGRVREHDPQSLAYPATADEPVTDRTWRRYGAVLDQGQLGSCTGNAAAQALNHAPLHTIGTACLHEEQAVALYTMATIRDAFPGVYPPDDTGSSGLAVAKACQDAGLITAYDHAFGLDHVLSAAMTAPLIVGTDWYDGMFYPDAAGQVFPTGQIAGGHEYVLDGVSVTHRMVRFLNSWSRSWGVYGRFYLSFNDFCWLLNGGGDAVRFRREGGNGA